MIKLFWGEEKKKLGYAGEENAKGIGYGIGALGKYPPGVI